MRLISYNVNGIRAASSKGLGDWIHEGDYDVVCMQEIKASPEQIDHSLFDGYECNWFPAAKAGYSGTAILTKRAPDFISKGMGNDLFDGEGRVIRADYGDTTLICAYFPSGSTGEVRQAVKMQFLSEFTDFVEKLRMERPKIILTGDFNICHKAIDINFPKKHEKVSGFLPEERAWFDSFVARGWIDSFREFCTLPERYSWWSYRSRAREKNLGWRIDYFMVTDNLKPQLRNADIFEKINFSDHCPVYLELEL
ncbi:MAG: exodeoxyribonuclease III [Prevotellaceae bacterium]|jgi:exodeoxyribonuclease-3|nr:exodeoxyribonuclease III [Prevotellaceae bacterium]